MKNTCAVLIPIYRSEFDQDEFFSIKSSLIHLQNYDIFWIAPENINKKYYIDNFNINDFSLFERLPDTCIFLIVSLTANHRSVLFSIKS